MQYPFYFRVVLFLSDEDTTYHSQSGLGLCTSFADAAKQIEEYYGIELCKILHLELLEAGDFFFMPDDVCKKYLENSDDFGIPIPCDEEGNIVPTEEKEEI